MKLITLPSLCLLSLVVTVTCESSAEEALVSNSGKVYNTQDKLLTALKQLMTSISITKSHIEDLSELIVIDFSELTTSISALQTSVNDNHVTIEGKIDDVTGQVNVNFDAINAVGNLLSSALITLEGYYDNLEDIILANSSTLLGSIQSLTTLTNTNQQTTNGNFADVDSKLGMIHSSLTALTQLGTTVLQNVQALDSQLDGVETKIDRITSNTREIINFYEIASCKTPGTSGVYKLVNPSTKVYCDMDVLDGGWLVIQQRVDLTLNFNRSWTDYRNGFGEIGKQEDFWLGLRNIHLVTRTGQYELAIEFLDKNKPKYAQYDEFSIAGESDQFRLDVADHSGTIMDEFLANDGMQFSAYDRDRDNSMATHCARVNGGGWWYNACGNSDLNRDSAPYWDEPKSYSRMLIRRKTATLSPLKTK